MAITVRWRGLTSITVGWDVVLDTFRGGLTACTSLHNLEICGELGFSPNEDPRNTEAWRLLLEPISHMPKSSLRHLTIRLSASDPDKPLPWTCPMLDWQALRATCSSLRNLGSITLACHGVNGLAGRWKAGGADRVLTEMGEFNQKGILFLECASPNPTCNQLGCRWNHKCA